MHTFINIINHLGTAGIDLFWLPVAIWTVFALLVTGCLKIAENKISPVYNYHSRSALLWGLAAGVIGSVIFHIIASTSPDAVGIPAQFIVIQSPISVTASPQTNQAFWSNPHFWIGAATAIAGLLALIALIQFMIECLSLRSLTHRLQQADAGGLAKLSDKNRQLLSSFSGAVNLLLSDDVAVPCTFGWFKKHIVIPKNLSADPGKLNMVVRHELTHIKNHDFLLNMITKVIRALFFFHPLVHALSKNIETYREMYCDQQVLQDSAISQKNYAQLLFDLAPRTGVTYVPGQNSFNAGERSSQPPFKTSAAINMAVQPSTLKKRIKTMKNATPNLPSFRWSISIVLVIALMITGLMACSDVSNNGITEADVQQTQANISKVPAGNAPLFIVNGEKMNTPEKRNIVSRIKPKYIKSINVLKDKKAVQAFGEAGKNGVVKIKMIDKKQAFNDLAAHARNSTVRMNPHKKKIFVAVQQPPVLKGGLAALQQKVKYPKKCREAGVEGRVTLQFVVNKQGIPTNIKVVKGIGHGCGKAAIKAVKKYARFTPGRQRGKPVLVKFALPIMFSLSGRSSAKQSTTPEKGHIVGQDMEIQNYSAIPNGTITGALYSKKTNKPLPGANIRVINPKTGEATTKGAATAQNGRFVLNVKNLKANPVKIKITYTGYKPMMIKFYRPDSSGKK